MARTLTEIYSEAVQARGKYLGLKEVNNNSKMSIINGITWIVAASIYSFETLLDTFMADVSYIVNSRINGTPEYYAQAMLKWQYGDELMVLDGGVSFGYSMNDDNKKIITHVTYEEKDDNERGDKILLLKVASGEKGNLNRLTDEQLVSARAYLNKIKFAGTKCNVTSRRGDVLIPRITVYYDGSVSKEDLYDGIDKALKSYIEDLNFDSAVYSQKIIDVVQRVNHVVDVHIDKDATVEQGIFLVQYNDSDEASSPIKVDRKIFTTSGYLRESSKVGSEDSFPTFREAIVLKVEER